MLYFTKSFQPEQEYFIIMESLFKQHGLLHQGVLSLTPREAMDLIRKGAVLVDLRELDFYEFKSFDLPKVIHLPLSVFDEKFSELPKDSCLILADTSGIISREKVKFLLQHDYKEIAGLAGGFVEWERDGMPVQTNINRRLTGACPCQLKPRERKKQTNG